jgi:hypothetical protein
MKRTVIALSVLFAVGLSTACDKGKDEVLPDGTKMFGEFTLQDGTQKVSRIESPNGTKQFDVTKLPDGSERIGRIESPDGKKVFEVTAMPDGTAKIARVEFPDGEKQFSLIKASDGSVRIGRTVNPDGTEGKSPDQAVVPSQSGGTSTDSQSTGAVSTIVAQTEPQIQSFTFRGVHAGMTIPEVKAATAPYRPRTSVSMTYSPIFLCVNNYGGPNRRTLAVECAFDIDDSSHVTLFFYRGKLFSIKWGCQDDCSKARALMRAHFGKPLSDKEESVPAEVGAFSEHVAKWRSPQESAATVGGKQFEVLNYDFAPSFVQRQ